MGRKFFLKKKEAIGGMWKRIPGWGQSFMSGGVKTFHYFFEIYLKYKIEYI